MKYNIYPYLDKRSTGKDGRHTAKIAISYNRKADYVNTGVYTTPEEWQQLFSEKVPKHLKEARDKIQSTESNVRTILSSIIVYDIKVLRLHIAGFNAPPASVSVPNKATLPTDVFHWFDLKIKELEEQKEAYGTAENYKDTKSFLMKYTGLTRVEFGYFTKDALYKIQKQATTVGGMAAGNVYRHARQLRAIFNMAMFEQVIDKSIYPFHKRGYVIPQTTKRKKSLSIETAKNLIGKLDSNPTLKAAIIDVGENGNDYIASEYYRNKMIVNLTNLYAEISFLKVLSDSDKEVVKAYDLPSYLYTNEPLPNYKAMGGSEPGKLYVSSVLLIQQFTNTLRQLLVILSPFLQFEPSLGSDEAKFQIIFDENTEITNITEGKEQFNDWFIILEGYAQLFEINRDDFEIEEITKNSPLRITIKSKSAVVGGILSLILPLINLEQAYLGYKTTIEKVKTTELVDKDLHDQYVQAAEASIEKKMNEHLDEIVNKKMQERELSADKKAAIHASVTKTYHFIVNGGSVQFFINEGEGKQMINQLEEAKDTVKRLREGYNGTKLITNTGQNN